MDPAGGAVGLSQRGEAFEFFILGYTLGCSRDEITMNFSLKDV